MSVTATMESGGDVVRTLNFAPLSMDDIGDYRCTGTIMPSTPNPLVTNGVGELNQTVSVQGE